MRYSKSMIEAVRQVAMYEQFDYVILDKDNKILARYKGRNAKKQAELNMKAAEKKVGVMKPLKVYPINPGDKRKIGDTIIAIGELTDKQRGEIEEDVKNALAGFDNRIRDAASMDRKDFIKAKELYKRKDVKGLRKHIYSLDTSPLEVVMNLISIQDRPFFDKMYPNTRGGEFLAKIAYDHRNLDEKLDENKDDEKKRMKGAKLRLKMGDALDEKFTKKDFDDNEDKNKHTENGVAVVNMFGTSAEKKKMADIAARHNKQGSIGGKDQKDRDAMVNKYYKRLKEGTIKEDGHSDVPSAIRQCKTITEDAMQIMGKLKSMNAEESLPTWWTNKLAVASNSMNKMRDYLLVPSMSEEVELDEKAGDTSDMKKLVGELQNASKLHLAQSKRVKAHVDMMKSGNLKGTLALAPIVGELEKASEAHKRQSKTIAKHMEAMTEELNKDDVETIMQMPEYLEAKEKFEANNTYGEYKVVDGKRVRVEVPMPFYPKFYSVDNAWIDDQEMRGKGHGKAIYEEWIRQAVKYSEGYGGVFIAGAHCTQTPNATSEDAKRVWKSLIRDYPTSSGLVIFIGEEK